MLDAILAEAAAAAGTEVPDGTAVTGLTIDGKRVTGVRYTTAEGEATERADLIMVGRWIALNTDETGGRALYAERPRLACTYYPYWVDVPIDFEIYERPGSWWPRFAGTTISTLADEYMPQARFAHVRRDVKAAFLAGITATAAALWQRFRVSPGRHTPRIRGHWSTETKVHRVHDVTYDEPSQIRTGTGPQVTAALRNAAISAPRTAGITNNTATNRHHARGNTRPYWHHSASPDDFARPLTAALSTSPKPWKHEYANNTGQAAPDPSRTTTGAPAPTVRDCPDCGQPIAVVAPARPPQDIR